MMPSQADTSVSTAATQPDMPVATDAPAGTKPPEVLEDAAAATEGLWRVYSLTNEWVRFADAKAGAILAADAVLGTAALGLLKGNQDLLTARVVALSVLCGAALVVSTYHCLVCIVPRTRAGGPRSPLFFGHIASFTTAADYTQAARALGDHRQTFAFLSAQVWLVSRIAATKHRHIAIAIWTLAISLLLALVAAAGALW